MVWKLKEELYFPINIKKEKMLYWSATQINIEKW